MTNPGVAGFPSGAGGSVADGSIPLGKLAAPAGWGRLVSGRYYFTLGAQSSGLTTSAALGNGTLRLSPWVVPHAVGLSVIGADVTTGTSGDSGCKVRLGIYADNGNCYPGSLILDAGTIAGDSTTVQDIAINVSLTAGLYWVGGAVQLVTTTQPTLRVQTAATPILLATGTSTPAAGTQISGYSQASVTSALPGVFTSSVTAASPVPRIHVKIA